MATSSESKADTTASPKQKSQRMSDLAKRSWETRRAKTTQPIDDFAEFIKIPLSKHKDELLYRAAYRAREIAKEIDKLAEEDAVANAGKISQLSTPLGIYIDKVFKGGHEHGAQARIPKGLLDSVTGAILRQSESATTQQPVLQKGNTPPFADSRELVADKS